MTKRLLLPSVVSVMALVMFPIKSEAQTTPTSRFDELQQLVQRGDTLRITDSGGHRLRGTLGAVTGCGYAVALFAMPMGILGGLAGALIDGRINKELYRAGPVVSGGPTVSISPMFDYSTAGAMLTVSY